MWFAAHLVSLALAQEANALHSFDSELRAAATTNDDAFFRAFYAEYFEGTDVNQHDEWLIGMKKAMVEWVANETHYECQAGLCELQTGPQRRPVLYIKAAPSDYPTAFLAHSHGKQARRFKERLSFQLRTNGRVRVLFNGQTTFVAADVQDQTAETSYLNDWLVVGENQIRVEPIDRPATIDLRVGGHGHFKISIDESRQNKLHFQGLLTEARTWSFVAEAAETPTETIWPTDPFDHMKKGLAIWLSGGDEYSFFPWPSDSNEKVRDQLRDAGAVTLEPLMMEIDITLADRWHLQGWFKPHSTHPRWTFAELEERVETGEPTQVNGPRALWANQVKLLATGLQDTRCPGALSQVPAEDIIKSIDARQEVSTIQERGRTTTTDLQRACEIFSMLPKDLPITYDYDDVLIVARDAKGNPVRLVDAELSFIVEPFIFSLFKIPRVPK